MRHWRARIIIWLKGHDRGTVAISFAMALPILIVIFAIVVQYALMINARIMVGRAATVAARSAMTALPTDPVVDEMDGPEIVRNSAYMALTPISPMSKDGPSTEAMEVLDALQGVGVQVQDNYANRFTYAQQATTISWQQGNYARRRAGELEITLTYRYFLNIPFANYLIGKSDTIAGVRGRFTTFTTTVKVQRTHGRQASADANGWPN